jgi:hypothetical protein
VARIDVQQIEADARQLSFRVTVGEGDGETRHGVTVSRDDYERLGGGGGSPEEFVRRCFRFLLERESKESILSRFDVGVIGRYFPEFEREIARPAG